VDRRAFIQSAFLTAAVCASTASAGNEQAALASEPHALTLYDPRFPKSRAVASRLAPASALRPIAGDVSELLAMLLTSEPRPLKLAGVTPESVPFCLEQLLSLNARPQLESIRLDADLFAWTLTTT
jgi:hypothetical protein